MTTATVGARYQIVIPRKERERMGLKPHAKVAVESRGDCLVIYPVSADALRGIGRELRDGTDATAYVKRLRREWTGRPS